VGLGSSQVVVGSRVLGSSVVEEDMLEDQGREPELAQSQNRWCECIEAPSATLPAAAAEYAQ
jgi:hypothetical protein